MAPGMIPESLLTLTNIWNEPYHGLSCLTATSTVTEGTEKFYNYSWCKYVLDTRRASPYAFL